MELTPELLKDMLVTPGHVSGADFSATLVAATADGIPVLTSLVQRGLISDEQLGKTIADFCDRRFIDLSVLPIKEEHLFLIPEVVARAQRAVVFGIVGGVIQLASEQLEHYEFLRLLEKKTGRRVDLFYATHIGIDTAIKRYKGDLHEKINTLIQHCLEGHAEDDVVQLANLLLEHADMNGASDIHIEPFAEYVIIRFRIDGILHECARYPKVLHEKIVFRIKIMSRMQTDEHAMAQDGRFEYGVRGESFDVRVSVLPIINGENIVMRLLDSGSGVYTLENLGFSEKDYAKIVRALEMPHGMVMAVGPTGSGKTTLLYGILRKLNDRSVNITTIEDPVEYHIDGAQQTQVNPKKDLTFAKGLRSIVRQDPDIIMVGEIRDEETADIAINAALTGHLLISTLHTNDAATTFPRLIEMNVEPFLIASSLNIVIALRLVRKICPQCKESYLIEEQEHALLELHPEILVHVRNILGNNDVSKLRLYRGKGCVLCSNSGYRQRVGIFEVLEVDDLVRALVTKSATASSINEQARASGMTSLLYDGIAKVLDGTTTLEEVLRVARS